MHAEENNAFVYIIWISLDGSMGIGIDLKKIVK